MVLFYGVHIINSELSSGLDLIRFFAEPDFFRRGHVTIRGPYKQRLSTDFEEDLERQYSKGGRILGVDGVGSFFLGVERSRQNTVFLKCQLPSANDLWRKPDFRDGQPHLTLYDGESRKFAIELRRSISRYPWLFYARTTNIEVLEKKKDPTRYLQVYFHRAQFLCDRLFDGEIRINSFDSHSDVERLYLIDRVAKYLHENVLSRSGIIS